MARKQEARWREGFRRDCATSIESYKRPHRYRLVFQAGEKKIATRDTDFFVKEGNVEERAKCAGCHDGGCTDVVVARRIVCVT